MRRDCLCNVTTIGPERKLAKSDTDADIDLWFQAGNSLSFVSLPIHMLPPIGTDFVWCDIVQ